MEEKVKNTFKLTCLQFLMSDKLMCIEHLLDRTPPRMYVAFVFCAKMVTSRPIGLKIIPNILRYPRIEYVKDDNIRPVFHPLIFSWNKPHRPFPHLSVLLALKPSVEEGKRHKRTAVVGLSFQDTKKNLVASHLSPKMGCDASPKLHFLTSHSMATDYWSNFKYR